MASQNAPDDPRKFTMIAFIAFAVVFVFAMIMMLWHGSFTHSENGERHYETHVNEP